MDYSPIQAFLVGRCGKTVRDAAMTSIAEYEMLAEGHLKRDQEEWERARWQIFMQWSISPQLKKRPRKPQDIIRFPWEEDKMAEVKAIEPLTENEIAGLCDMFKLERKTIINGQDK